MKIYHPVFYYLKNKNNDFLFCNSQQAQTI